uniref:RAD protein n=1 Tax=Zonotrichia albicollis TaxID=44394 RepID=A0A8D2N242_ZONAL
HVCACEPRTGSAPSAGESRHRDAKGAMGIPINAAGASPAPSRDRAEGSSLCAPCALTPAGRGNKGHTLQMPRALHRGNTYDRSIIVDGEEASLVVFDIWEQDDSQWLQNHCMKMGDAYIIVYSVTDKVSFEKASELRIQLRRARQTEDIPIILVGNKSDLVRSREVSVDEGRACAVVFDCKFIETSAALHHNVKDLFEGIVRQIRLRKDSKEDNARRMANAKRRESISKKAKRFLGRIVAKNNKKMAFKAKSKSCHDLSVL